MAEIINEKQSLLDIALQTGGAVEAGIALSFLKGISLTDDLEPGATVETVLASNANVVTYYTNKGIVPATALSNTDASFGGINYMGIELDFIVS